MRVDLPVDEHLVEQQHGAYTSADHRVWREALARSRSLVKQYGRWMHPAYVDGLRRLTLSDHVPRIEEINERLAPTGWRAVCVDGFIPSTVYVGLISTRIFPISRVIRRFEHIDYAPSPDLIHDVLGHLPVLFSMEHRDFIRRLATVMTRAAANELDNELYEANRAMSALKSDPSSSASELSAAERRVRRVHRALITRASDLTHLRRMYLWTVEFGLIGEPEAFRVYGAGLLSANAELRAICAGAIRPSRYSLEVIDQEIEFSDMQEHYYVASDFAHLHEVLTTYERVRAPKRRT
jgi:phenylalanine-4-hydroxylase